jgi:hypothetical protein
MIACQYLKHRGDTMAKWREYEKMVERIYKELMPLATVTHNDKIMGKDSGVERQIDVSIKTNLAGHDILIIIQAKHYERPPNVTHVDGFSNVIKDVRASKGIMISNIGFTKTAIKLAVNQGIDLCSAYDAESRDWKSDLTIPVLWVEIVPVLDIRLLLSLEKGDSLLPNITENVFSNDGGKTRLLIAETFIRLWNEDQLPKELYKIHHLDSVQKDIKVLVGPGKWQAVDQFNVSYLVKTRAKLKYFDPIEFRGIKNHLTGEIQISSLKLRIEPIMGGEGWTEIPDLNNLSIETKGLIVTAIPEINTVTMSATQAEFNLISTDKAPKSS